MGMLDISKIAEKIQAEADPDANIIFGATSCDDFEDAIRVTVIATGFEQSPAQAAAPEAKAAPAPVVPTGDITDIDEVFKIFNR